MPFQRSRAVASSRLLSHHFYCPAGRSWAKFLNHRSRQSLQLKFRHRYLHPPNFGLGLSGLNIRHLCHSLMECWPTRTATVPGSSSPCLDRYSCTRRKCADTACPARLWVSHGKPLDSRKGGMSAEMDKTFAALAPPRMRHMRRTPYWKPHLLGATSVNPPGHILGCPARGEHVERHNDLGVQHSCVRQAPRLAHSCSTWSFRNISAGTSAVAIVSAVANWIMRHTLWELNRQFRTISGRKTRVR